MLLYLVIIMTCKNMIFLVSCQAVIMFITRNTWCKSMWIVFQIIIFYEGSLVAVPRVVPLWRCERTFLYRTFGFESSFQNVAQPGGLIYDYCPATYKNGVTNRQALEHGKTRNSWNPDDKKVPERRFGRTKFANSEIASESCPLDPGPAGSR